MFPTYITLTLLLFATLFYTFRLLALVTGRKLFPKWKQASAAPSRLDLAFAYLAVVLMALSIIARLMNWN